MNLKVIACVGALVAAFIGGYQYAAALYERDIAELREAEAVTRADQGRKDYAKIVKAMDEAEKLRGNLDASRADADRVRRAYERRLREARASGKSDGEAVSRSDRLLKEGIELLQEGRELLERNAVKHDGLAEAVK